MPYHTNKERRLLYAFRGWIAFVAFMDLGTDFRSYIERRSFLDHVETQYVEGILFISNTYKHIYTISLYIGDYTVARIIGMYSLLKAITLVHCTLYIHYKPYVFNESIN